MLWSSLPLTIHLPPVTLKLANTQYLLFSCPLYVFKHFPVWKFHSRNVLSSVDANIYFPLGENLTNELYWGGDQEWLTWFIYHKNPSFE